MDFGLGLVLSFTDNASAGMNNAVQSLNNLTSVAENASNSLSTLGSTASLIATSTASNMIGDNFIKAGKGMLGMFNTLIAKTQSLGSEYEGFGVTLSALGMDSETAIKKLFAFANKSPLEVGDVKDMIVTLQAQGINAFGETTGAISGTRQEFLAFLTDLKSFKPEVANERFKMAIQNYIGSGEKKMMRTVFDMGDIEDIIGHGVSDTAEGRMQDIVEMVENKGLTGLSKSMAETWQGVASNIDDAFTRIFYSVANDGGVFEKLKKSFVDLANVIIELPEEELASLGKTIGSALNTIVTPLTKLVNWTTKGVKSLIELSQTHPALLKWGIVLTTVAGGLLVFSGVMFKIIGSLASFVLVMQSIGKTVSVVSEVFKIGLGKMSSAILPLVGAIGLLALAWKTDFGGIRTMTLNFVNHVSKSFREAKDAVNGSVNELVTKLIELRSKDDFWSNITIGLMEIYATFKFVAEAWNDNTLSEESFQKANKLGILPLIEGILDLKYRFEHFKKGFVQGWNEVKNTVLGFFNAVAPKLEGTIFQSLVDGITDLFKSLNNNDPESWERIGESFGKIVSKGLLMLAVLKPLLTVLKPLVTVIKAGAKAGGVFSAVFSKIGQFIAPLTGALSTVALYVSSFFEFLAESGSLVDTLGALFPQLSGAIEGFASVIGGISAPVVAVVGIILAVIGSVVAFAVTQKDKFIGMINSVKETFSNTIDKIKQRFSDGMNSLKQTFEPIISRVLGAFSNLKEAVTTFGDGMKDSPIIKFFGYIGEAIMNKVVPVVKILISLVGGTLGSAFKMIAGIVGGVFSFIGGLVSGTINIVSGFINIIAGIFTLNPDKICKGFEQIISGILEIGDGLLTGLYNIGNSVRTFVIEGFTDAFETAKDVVSDKITSIKTKISEGLDTIKGLFSKLKLEFPKIKTPHFNITSGEAPYGIGGKGTAPKVDISWYAKGGVFDSPSIIGVGEKGKEAVVPLENNTGWIDNLASKISSNINSVGNGMSDISVTSLIDNTAIDKVVNAIYSLGTIQKETTDVTPINRTTNSSNSNSNIVTNNDTNNDNSVSSTYITRNNTNTNNNSRTGSVDNSVHFEKGSIVIEAKDFSVEEAKKFAEMIMNMIKRKKEIKDMLNYSTN